jgi:hypothetical protein
MLTLEEKATDVLRKTSEILDHMHAVVFWVIEYAEKYKIPLDDGLAFHLNRVKATLDEMGNPLETNLAKRIVQAKSDEKYHHDDSDDKVPLPIVTKFICCCYYW